MNATQSAGFVERRSCRPERSTEVVERRQFAESRDALSPEVRELGEAVDAYKLANHRRYVTLAEVLELFKGLGYRK